MYSACPKTLPRMLAVKPTDVKVHSVGMNGVPFVAAM